MSDKNKRQLYDQYGFQGLDPNYGGGSGGANFNFSDFGGDFGFRHGFSFNDANDIFKHFFEDFGFDDDDDFFAGVFGRPKGKSTKKSPFGGGFFGNDDFFGSGFGGSFGGGFEANIDHFGSGFGGGSSFFSSSTSSGGGGASKSISTTTEIM